MMNTLHFLAAHSFPILPHLSAETRRLLEDYLQDGNTSFRQRRLVEFFKTLDWLPEADVVQDRFFQKLSPALRRHLKQDIRTYHDSKAKKRSENAVKREQYKLKIIEYFRAKVSAADKALLESLRDYELDLTGRDVNWRYYFTLDSFKKIDAFVDAEPFERHTLFERFKKDVDTYQRNYEKIHQAQAAAFCEHAFSFDDWCDMMGDQAPGTSGRQKRQAPPETPAPANPVYQACQTLGVSLDASQEAVKKQFRKLTLQHHPDLPNGSEEKMKTLVGAYQELQRYWRASRL